MRTKREITRDMINDIIDVVCKVLDVTRSGVLSKSKSAKLVMARHICMYLIKKHNEKVTFLQISESLNVKKPQTAMYAKRKIEGLLEVDPEIKALCQECEFILEQELCIESSEGLRGRLQSQAKYIRKSLQRNVDILVINDIVKFIEQDYERNRQFLQMEEQ